MTELPEGLTVRRVPYRTAPDADLAALHFVETEINKELRPDRAPEPLQKYITFARNFPAHFTEWTWLTRDGDGAPIASSSCWYRHGEDPTVMRCFVFVLPGWRRRGVGRHLLGLIGGVAAEQGRSLLLGWTADTAPAGEPFARSFGARPGRVTRTSEVWLDEIDWSMTERWAHEGPRRAPGYSLQLIEGPYPPELYADAVVFHEIMETAPRDDLEVASGHTTTEQIAEWEKLMVEQGRGRWVLFVRDPSGACVGGTEVEFVPWQPDTAFQGDTGIHPDHRGKGLGKWVKAAMLEKIRAERPEAKRMPTGNAYSNAPMLAINDAIGFRVTQSRIDWQLDVADVVRLLRA